MLFAFSCGWVDYCDCTVYAGEFEYLADAAIELVLVIVGHQIVQTATFVAFQNLECGLGEIYLDYAWFLVLGFARDVLDCRSFV